MDKEVLDSFVESWGAMGSIWGVNTSVARVHALLIATDKPLSLDDIAESLKISRGNANTCLRELRNWNVIKLIKVPGDRHDYYVSEDDVWKMTFAIARERKRREYDPALAAVRHTLSKLKKGSDHRVESRLKQMEEMLATLDGMGEKLFANEKMAQKALSMLSVLAKIGK